jgi:uncharacterized phage infection (PIP) family protein YhgE
MVFQKEAIAALREIIEARLTASDKAVGLVREGHAELKAAVTQQIGQLRELHDEKFVSIKSDIDTKFAGIQTQFVAFERLREQLSVADKVAVAAALQAQKESAGAMQLANAEALEKMAAGFTKQIDGTVLALQALAKNMDEKIQDLKGRMDRGEGRTSVSDPAVSNGILQLTSLVQNLSQSRDMGVGRGAGQAQLWTGIAGTLGVLVAIISLGVAIAAFSSKSPFDGARYNVPTLATPPGR